MSDMPSGTLQTADQADGWTYHEAGQHLRLGYEQIVELVQKEVFTASRRQSRGMKYIPRKEVEAYAKLRGKSRPELVRELIEVYIERDAAPPSAPSSSSRSRRARPGSSSTAGTTPPASTGLSAQQVRDALLGHLVESLEAHQQAKVAHEQMRREPGEEVEVSGKGTAREILFGFGFLMLFGFLFSQLDDEAIVENWRETLRQAETNPVLKRVVNGVLRQAGLAPLTEAADPRQIELFNPTMPDVAEGVA